MEVRVNKDIKEYKENMFFGLTLRQFIFSVLGCIVAVILYFALKDKLGLEVATWVCVLGVAPFAALGFLRYNGMPAEQVFIAWLRTKWINPRKYLSQPASYYYEAMEESIAMRQGSLTRKELRSIRRRDRRQTKAEAKAKRKSGKRRRR
ncbi:MAG: PrgI family protein [Bacillota bacterium]|nr:PrgI family protein [Bacillota bacterium]